MDYIDCRNNDDYNEKYLNEIDSQYVTGFDTATRSVDTFFANLDAFECSKDGFDLYGYLESHEDVKETLKADLLSFLEGERNQTIVAILDDYSEEDYDSIRKQVDAGEYKNAIVRTAEWEEKFKNGEIPTAYEYLEDPETGEIVKKPIYPSKVESEE